MVEDREDLLTSNSSDDSHPVLRSLYLLSLPLITLVLLLAVWGYGVYILVRAASRTYWNEESPGGVGAADEGETGHRDNVDGGEDGDAVGNYDDEAADAGDRERTGHGSSPQEGQRAEPGTASSRRQRAPGAGEPARPSYLFALARAEAAAALRVGWKEARSRLRRIRDQARDEILEKWVTGASLLLLFSIQVSVRLAVAMSAVVLVAVMLTTSAVLLGAVLVQVCFMAVLGGLETLLVVTRQAWARCPRDAGCGRIGLAVFSCPHCGERHRRLMPNRYGVFRHVCLCGARMPTTSVLGRYRLSASCPHCARPLPPRIGVAPVVELPMVGGSAAGKTTLLHLMLAALQTTARPGEEYTFHNPTDAARLREGLEALSRGERLPPTTEPLPDAFVIRSRVPQELDRLIFVYDPPGEVFGNHQGIEAQQYLGTARVLIVAVNPFALTRVREVLTESQWEAVVERDPSATASHHAAQAPSTLVDKVATTLLLRRKNPVRRVALVVTRCDLLREIAPLLDPSQRGVDVEEWLSRQGMGHSLAVLRRKVDVGCFTSGLGSEPVNMRRIVDWTVAGSRRRSPIVRLVARYALPINFTRPWRARGAGRTEPVTYVLWRMCLIAVQSATALLTPLGLVFALVWML